jgi:hypothetical protein
METDTEIDPRTDVARKPQLSTADFATAGARPRPELAEGRSVESVQTNAGSGHAVERVPAGIPSNAGGAAAMDLPPLYSTEENTELKRRWDTIQASFVDEPRDAVEQADGLVASAMARLAEKFAEERRRLEGHWDRGDQVTTEDLRVALRRYRSFFTRLLSV